MSPVLTKVGRVAVAAVAAAKTAATQVGAKAAALEASAKVAGIEASAKVAGIEASVKECFGSEKTTVDTLEFKKALERTIGISKPLGKIIGLTDYLKLTKGGHQVLLTKNKFSTKETSTSEPQSPIPADSTKAPTAKSSATKTETSTVDRTVSPKLVKTTKPVPELNVHCDTKAIDDLLGAMASEHLDLNNPGTTDILMDVGSKMTVKVNGECLQHDRIITRDDIDNIIQNLPGGGPDIKKTNRVMFGQTLHRLAAVGYDGNINGVTIRLGRRVSGLLPLFEDLIEQKNILLCGAPNVGKTTALREICKHLAQKRCLCLIDSSGEICGDFENKDHIVGAARVFRPHDPDRQYMTLLDCVRNHSADVIAIDELNTKGEVEVCQTIALRSIQMVACVHGNIQDLVFNPMLNKALGGTTQATVSDRVAVDGRKVVNQRSTRPIFDVVINIKRTPMGLDYMFVENVADNVSKIIEGKPIQTRTRRINGGTLEETTEEVIFPLY
ncbi:hypothetical protein EMPS_03836 [Entomortierella parvispora]|uniref:AAA+ ATPase domain-containing protein n=1 Tax=Entomortierella parvispora TaxID=205924 RepID=A0A9P3LUT6_9FUNG|nr:hypothetical protein EMPS_03836 [Entomortierella parvispora]